MTNREFYTAIANLESASSELKAFANAAIQKLDHRNAVRAATPSKSQVENEKLYPQVLALLNPSEPMLSTAIATSLGVTTNKAVGILGNLYKENKVVKVDVSVKGKGKQRGWLLVG